VDGLAAVLDRGVRVGLVDRRLARLELLALADDGSRLVQLLPQLLGAGVIGRCGSGPAHPAVDGDCGTRGTGQPGGPGSHEADATLAAFLPRLAPFAPELRLPARPTQTEGSEVFGSVTDYEILLMLDPELPEERQTEIVTRAREAIEKDGGRFEAHEPWGRRRLEYEIDHKKEGTYHLLTFAAEPATLEEISRVLKITDGVMRHLAVRRVVGSTARPPEPTPEEPVAVAAVERQDAETESSAPESAGEENE